MSLGAQGAWLLTNPATAIPTEIGTAALSKLLHSRAGVKALTEGIRVGVGNKTAATLAASTIGKMLERAEQDELPDEPDDTVARIR